MNITNVDVETNLEASFKMITGVTRSPWRLDSVICEIICRLTQGDFTLRHVLREADFVANFLARLDSSSLYPNGMTFQPKKMVDVDVQTVASNPNAQVETSGLALCYPYFAIAIAIKGPSVEDNARTLIICLETSNPKLPQETTDVGLECSNEQS
ncbi:hypothetical protein ACH5RR_018519 [Cinchona calisaya]|uniref:Uncharacterized protein n=1 Tax=Cinchona calisaya TaxID=153742 RepID=A0ABD2ZLQ3_9GENT